VCCRWTLRSVLHSRLDPKRESSWAYSAVHAGRAQDLSRVEQAELAAHPRLGRYVSASMATRLAGPRVGEPGFRLAILSTGAMIVRVARPDAPGPYFLRDEPVDGPRVHRTQPAPRKLEGDRAKRPGSVGRP
jgi:hypothetical protein